MLHLLSRLSREDFPNQVLTGGEFLNRHSFQTLVVDAQFLGLGELFRAAVNWWGI